MEKIICNPLNLEYRYQYKNSPLGTGVFREAADPTIVLFHGTYLLFPSMSGGFWYSEDLAEWQYKATPELPIYDYAPDVREVNGGITFCASRRGENCGIYFSRDPLREPFHQVSAPFPFWDPDIFQDDDGRVYLYWGCDTRTPIWGIELDRNTLTPIGEKRALIRENEKEHGWERVGENNVLGPPKTMGDRIIRMALGTKPCIEGSFLTKYRGKYYFQYATPGTEHNVYADGVYVGDSPLGPFRYQVHNPFAARPGGFITASGHGSTFQDKEGRWWHTSTMRISVNNNYERRVGLFPCAFDEDGVLWCNQNFADYPMDLTRDAEDRMSPVPSWMLLSWRAKVTASSAQKGYEAEHASDESIRTWWAAMPSDRKASLQMDLGSVKSIKAIQVNFADHKLPLLPISKKEMVKENIGYRKIVTEKQKTAFVLEISLDGENWTVVRDNRRDNTDYPHDLILLPDLTACRYLRLRDMEVPMGGVPAVSGLRVFGKGKGQKPAKVRNVQACPRGEIDIGLAWDPAEGADGYNVRYGIAPDKLYLSWQFMTRQN